MAYLMLERRQRGFISSMKGKTMRKFELIIASLIWFAAAVVMPMAALAPVQAAHAAPAAAIGLR